MWGLAGGPGNVRFPALSLYGHFRATRGSTYDVTVGGTGLCDYISPVGCTGGVSPNGPGQTLDCAWGVGGVSDSILANRYQCYAQPGFDGVSGVGTPRGVTVFKAMTPRAVIKSPGTVTHGVTHTFSAAGSTDPFPGGGLRAFAWNWGDGHSTSTTSVTTTHKYAAKGTRTITLTVTDVYGIRGTRKITLTVK
jgi:PKD repeat protein